MNNPFDYNPDAECREAFKKLLLRIETLKRSPEAEDVNFCLQMDAGKMLGVLIAVDKEGNRHTLNAFSGQLADSGFHFPGFVEPVFDYLSPDGYFKKREADISRQTRDIASFEAGILASLREEYNHSKLKYEAEIADYKEKMRISKATRDSRRASGAIDESEFASMTRQSQFEKAEFRRLKTRIKAELEPLMERLQEAELHLDSLKEKRRHDSEELQEWLFSNFRLLNAYGESKSLSEIFSATPLRIPPSGAGECCAPKLLQAAYRRGLSPVAIAEYWYGKSKEGEVRIHGHHYPACRGKCLPVLTWMLKGLSVEPPLDNNSLSQKIYTPEIIYENEWFCLVNKPSGMLSVPGKGPDISVQEWLAGKYDDGREVKVAHRLDQDTSGLLVATFGPLPFKLMQSLFATRRVRKTYVADLEGDYTQKGLSRSGVISLQLSPDWLDRPRQLVNIREGKEAVTKYEFIEVSGGRSRVMFHPLTGRTHQLRVHSASAEGLGMPIAGDRLYGNPSESGRLHLHAHKLDFVFPIDGEHYSFEAPVPF